MFFLFDRDYKWHVFVLLAENIFHAADKILVPVIPTTLSERTLSQLVKFFKQNAPNQKPKYAY